MMIYLSTTVALLSLLLVSQNPMKVCANMLAIIAASLFVTSMNTQTNMPQTIMFMIYAGGMIVVFMTFSCVMPASYSVYKMKVPTLTFLTTGALVMSLKSFIIQHQPYKIPTSTIKMFPLQLDSFTISVALMLTYFFMMNKVMESKPMSMPEVLEMC